MLLGCIADDFTGATDLANNLVRSGMRAVQMIGVPTQPVGADIDAVVVALKSRTEDPARAVADSLAAARYLLAQGAQQLYFKYCSTFDSTPRGNIGPVAEALMDLLGEDFTIACPAFPEAQRTIYKGYLFVGDIPLDESGMRNHPLTPMTDANLVRVLQQQTTKPVGRIDIATVARGADAIRARIDELRSQKIAIAIVDAIGNDDMMTIGAACAGLKLVTAGSGIAIGLPQNWGIAPNREAAQLPAASGARAVISGSCSVASNRQVAHLVAQGRPAFAVDPLRLAQGEDVVEEACAWARPLLGAMPLLVYATAQPDAVRAVQEKLGVDRAGALVEDALSAIARRFVDMGVRQLIVAGGETSGACVQALGVGQLQIGPQIDPGVPWCHAQASAAGNRVGLHLALKSGNFGAEDFFTKAFDMLA